MSFAAIGADAARLVTPHDLRPQFGDSSPVSRLYEAMVAAVDFATPWFAAHRGRGVPAPHGASGPT